MLKNRILTAALVANLQLLSAQIPGEFIGISYQGGTTGTGTVYSVSAEGNNLKSIYNFTAKNVGGYPQKSELCLASNGKFYGVTLEGGTYDAGVLFEYDPVTKEYATKYVFDIANGESPYGGLVDVNGKLYGTTRYGGSSDLGVLFTYDIAANKFTKIYNCTSAGPIGYNPVGLLLRASNGKIYGLTRFGSGFGLGAVFEIDPATTAIRKVIDMPAGIGRAYGGLMEASNGKFYGVTLDGGANSFGALFEFNLATPSVTKKAEFDGTITGKFPYGQLVQANNGKLYGTCSEGGLYTYGTIFEYNIETNTLTKQIDFDKTNNGQNPYVSLYKTPTGTLYGVTSAGGKYGTGVLFKFNTSSGVLTRLYDFSGSEGYSPQCGLTIKGTYLYSMASSGGKTIKGMIFKLDTTTNTFTKEVDFCANDVSGLTPYGGFEKGPDEKYYFVTNLGGVNNAGTLNAYNSTNGSVTKIYDFTSSTGSDPYAEPVLVENGKLYGTTGHGGVYDNGTIYEFNPATQEYKKLYDFENKASGYVPVSAKLLFASNKKIYGLTNWGGENGSGVIFEFDPSSNVYTVKTSMPKPYTGFATTGNWSGMVELNGKFYFVTSGGGSANGGLLLEYNPATNELVKKAEFNSSIGTNPYGGLTVFGQNIYGACSSGGANSLGSIFEFNPSDGNLSLKYSFTSANNSLYRSQSRLFLWGNNKFYGIADYGGMHGFGGIFEFEPVSSNFKTIVSFDAVNAAKGTTAGNLLGFCDPITITRQPADAAYKVGQTLSLGIQATGTNLSYKWMKENSTVLLAKSFTKTISSGDFGKYICKVTNGCRIVDSDTARITLATGVSDDLKLEMSVFPNPCPGILYVDNIEGSGTIEFFNSMAQMVKMQEVQDQKTEIDLTTLTDGVYYYKLTIKEQVVKGKIVLKKE